MTYLIDAWLDRPTPTCAFFIGKPVKCARCSKKKPWTNCATKVTWT